MHATAHTAPGPRGLPLLRNTLDLWDRDPLRTLVARQRRYGDFIHTRVAGNDTILLHDPDAIRHVLQLNHANYVKGPAYALLGVVVGEGLLTSEGSFWLRQRRLAQPAFHKKYLETFAEIMARNSQARRDTWRSGDEVDFAEEMMRLTFSIVGEALFSAEVDGDAGEIGEIVTKALGLFERFVGLALLLPPTMIGRVPLPARRRIVDRLDAIVFGIIEGRRRDPRPRGDLLEALMAARDDDGEPMSDKQLKDEVMTLILAGHETTANALAWTVHLLMRHREVEERLVEEHRRVLGEREPTLADMAALPFTDLVVKESMRLYPPAWIFTRRAKEADAVGDYRIPAGAVVQIAPWSMHRHPEHWHHPDRFDPDRFSEARGEGTNPWVYLPFGGGARICIGKGFAMLEAKMVLASILRRFAFVPQGGPPVPQPSVTLRPRDGLPVRVRDR